MRFPHLAILSLITLAISLTACASTGASPTPAPRVTATSPVPSLAAPLPHSYAALGASETYGVGATPYHRGYAYLVAHDLGARHFVDVGIPGTTLPAGYEIELTRALETRPSLCTVFFGVNDLRAGIHRGAFIQDMHDLVATLRRAHAQVIIIGIPNLALVPAVAAMHLANLQQVINSWNAGMRQVARETGARFFDLTRYDSEIQGHPGYVAPDGLHPSNAGHARLAHLLVQYVRSNRLWH
jgi:lysophospholipase L1-like esterase